MNIPEYYSQINELAAKLAEAARLTGAKIHVPSEDMEMVAELQRLLPNRQVVVMKGVTGLHVLHARALSTRHCQNEDQKGNGEQPLPLELDPSEG